MSNKRNDLYNWERFSKPRVHSSSQRIVKEDDIQNWIKKVEDASSMAAAAAFGTKYTPPARKAKAVVAATVEDVRLHDAAYVEAQELLQQWVTDKLDLAGDADFTEESWTKKTEAEIKKEWDNLLGGGGDRYDADLDAVTARTAAADKDPYSFLDKDEHMLVGDVMQRLLDKEVVAANVLEDLGLETNVTRTDPRTKMILRHEQVKENREKREREKRRKLKELHDKKAALFQARQIVMKEDQVKALQKKKEEDAIQQEMAKIRKEMDEEKKRNYEQKIREQREKDEFDHRVLEEMERQKIELKKDQVQVEQKTEYRKRLIKERLKEMETKEAIDNLKLVQRCFSAWYNVVMERHLQAGKAKAMAEWKLLLKTYNAWKSYTRAKHMEKQALIHEAQVKLLQRKQVLAEENYKYKLLRKCFLAWQLYIYHQHHTKDITSEQSKTKNKMAAFLEAAATGKLWSARSDEGDRSRSAEISSDVRSVPRSGRSTARKVDDMFDGAGRQLLPPDSARSDSTSASSSRSERTSGGRQRTNSDHGPLQAWQITRKHVQVTKDDLARVENQKKDVTNAEDALESSRSRGKKPYVVNNFEHRHMAQQKVLEVQQKQIKEQQRLIDEMQYLQKQQILQQQLTHQQLLQQKLGWTSGNSGANSANNTQTLVMDLKIEELDEVENMEASAGHAAGSATERTTASAATCGADSSSAVSSTVSKASTDTKHIKFLKSMDERAQERSRIKQERDEKRRKAEEEKLVALQLVEEQKRKEMDAEKRKRSEAYYEKKRLEKQKEQEKQCQMDKMKQLMAVAEEHSRLATIKYRGWLPMQRLVTMARNNMECAQKHHQRTLLRQTLLSWKDCIQEDLADRHKVADDMFNFMLIRRCLSNWKKVGQYMVIQDEKARRHYEMNLKVKVIRVWADYATEEKMAMWKKERLAKEHNTKRVVLTAFRTWKRYPQLIKEEQKRQKRLEQMRKKVTSILPDFDGVSKSRSSSEFFS